MKRLISAFLSVVIMVCMVTLVPDFDKTVYAETEGNYTYTVSNGEASITDCNASVSGEITIPSTLGGYPVIGIGEYAFEYCNGLISVTIPNSVRSIGNYAFYGCHSLTSVTIPNSVTSIGNATFWLCNSLLEINVDSNNNYYSSQDGVLFNKSSTMLITYPGGKSGEYVIPNSVINIDDYAFRCSSLTSVTIPSSIISIGKCVFWGCQSLVSINADSNNNYFSSQDGALFNKGKTVLLVFPGGKSGEYVIPSSVTSIGDYAFTLCNSLSSITIPDSVTCIGNNAFLECNSLTSLTIPYSVSSIGESVFEDCDGLTTINIPSSVTSIGKRSFACCRSLTLVAIPSSVTSIGEAAFEVCSSLTSINIPNSVASIENSVFRNCRSLSSVMIPNSVRSIGNYAFAGCESLTLLSIPDSVISIGNGVFEDCDGLISITIPSSVTSMGDHAFCGCENLKSVILPGSVTNIGEGVFSMCKSLTSVTIPSSVTSIGNWAFQFCSSLNLLTIQNSVTSIGEWAFVDCYDLTIYCNAGSYAEEYAKNKLIKYALIKEFPFAITAIKVEYGVIWLDIDNYDNATKNLPVLLVAIYDGNDKLIKIIKKEMVANIKTYPVYTDIPPEMAKVRVYMWENLTNMIPTAAPSEYVNNIAYLK